MEEEERVERALREKMMERQEKEESCIAADRMMPNDVRSMLWVDFREVLRTMGAKVKKTPQELHAEIERLIRG